MIYDCFMVYDELDLLEIRMNILDAVVDYFVITEATTTQMGNPKEMYFQRGRKRFDKFEEKIIYNPINMEGIEFVDQWHREVYQKDYCINGLDGAEDSDIIIFSDLDEIPNPNAIRKVLENFNDNMVYHFAQDLFYFFINYQNIDGLLLSSTGEFPGVKEKKWLGTKLCTVCQAKKYGLDSLRHNNMLNETAVRVSDGGWHFSYMGGTNAKIQNRIKNKMSAYSHSEYNRWRYYNWFHIWWSILLGKDFLGRTGKFKKVKIGENYPQWLRDNLRKYPQFIL